MTMLGDNNLLAALRPADLDAIVPVLKPCRFEADAILYEPGDTVSHVYFPRGAALASFRVAMEDGRAIETVMVGREGAIGGIVSHGRLPAYSRACVVHGGHFYRVPLHELEALKEQSAAIRRLFARYADCLLAQIFQSVACNAAHPLDRRAAKWLSAAAERTGSFDLVMTQEQLAAILGVGRSYASRVIQKLKREGAIQTRRGGIVVTDPARLEAIGCRCNALVAAHFDEVLPGIYC